MSHLYLFHLIQTAHILNQDGIQCPQLVKSINLTTHETQIEGAIIYIIQLFYNHHMTRMADQTIIFEILESPPFRKYSTLGL